MNDNIHDLAMRHVREQVLERLLEHMTQAQRASVHLLMQRMLVIAGGPGKISEFRAMVLLGADRRSAHLLACLRAAQLSLAKRYGRSFLLRVLVARLPGLDSTTLALHDRCFGALFLEDDSRVELLRADAGQIGPYSARPVATTEQRAVACNAWLLFGHLGVCRPEALLGARAYLELATVLDQALHAGTGVDALFTVLPTTQRHRFMAWGRHCLRAITGGAADALPHGVGVLAEGLMQLHNLLALPLQRAAPMALRTDAKVLQVIALEGFLQQLENDDLLDRMLGRVKVLPCEVHGPAGLFDPVPLAHLRGLYAQFIEQRGYRAGSRAVVEQFAHLPVQWPQPLREDAQERLADALGVTIEQLVCQAFAPFSDQGRRLELFLVRCHPGMLVALPALHRALEGRRCASAITAWLMQVSGLEMAQLRALYAGALRPQVRRLVALLARRDIALRALAQASPIAPPAQQHVGAGQR